VHPVVVDALEKCLKQGVDVSGVFEAHMTERKFAEELYNLMFYAPSSHERYALFKLLYLRG
jgi:hypothetical protein